MSVATAISIPQLRAELHGRAIVPGDPDYDETRVVMYDPEDAHPGVIIRAADVSDVVRAVSLAGETGLDLAIRCGGHSAASHSTVEGGIVLDLRDLRDIDIDVVGRTVWAGGGLTAVELSTAVGAEGLAIGFGDTGSVGIGGITTGGGIGYLARKDGLTIDNLLAAEIVTADGQILRVDADTHPDLFWAIRGGGGNFGVVTRFQFRLHPLDHIVGGILILPATPDTVAAFVAAAEAAAEELSTIANVMNCPPMPFVPEEVHGTVVIMGILCYAGDTPAGERSIAPFRAIAKAHADLVHESPYVEIYPPEDPDYHPKAVSKTMFIDRVDRAVAETIVAHLEASDAPLRVAQIRVLGGAVARVPSDETAYAHRKSRILVNVASFYEGPDDKPVREAWVDDLAAAIYQGDDGAYVNFVGDEGPERVRAAYPGATWDRLAVIKARYDPTNLFHRNQNIPPATPAN